MNHYWEHCIPNPNRPLPQLRPLQYQSLMRELCRVPGHAVLQRRGAEGKGALRQNGDFQLINSLPPGGQTLHQHQMQITDKLIEVLTASPLPPEGGWCL